MDATSYQLGFGLLISLFVLICALIWVQQSYFGRQRKSFICALLLVLLSGMSLGAELYQVLVTPPAPQLQVLLRQPTVPL
jgi:hypothetical protein